jgi:hypothetical protein
MAAAAFVVACLLCGYVPAVSAALLQRIVVTDDTGTGLSGEGLIQFRTESGQCVADDCLGLLDGISITFEDGGLAAGDYWEIPGRVASVAWSIDRLIGVLTGRMLLTEIGRLEPELDFTAGVATNRPTGATGTLVASPVSEPAAARLLGVGLAAFALMRRRRAGGRWFDVVRQENVQRQSRQAR